MPIYKKMYTGSGDATRGALPTITVHAHKLNSVAIPFFSQGYINKLVVVQTGGTGVNFKVELLDSGIPYPAGEQDDSTSPADNIELYRIVAQQSGTSGNALQVIDDNHGYPFINMDSLFTINQRFVYLVIIPTSSATDTTWDVSIVGHDGVT